MINSLLVKVIRFNENNSGYTNEMINDNLIVENYNPSIETITRKTDKSDRLVFQIKENNGSRNYIFSGFFGYSEDKSTIGKNVLNKISDTYE